MKKIFKKVIKGIIHPNLVASLLLEKCGKSMPDKPYLQWQFFLRTGKKLNLDHPATFNEKLQWLKLYNRKDEYTKMADKLEARRYVSEKIGENHLIPLLGVWDNFDDIDFEKLPNQFVLKTNHDSGGLVICKNKKSLNTMKAKKIIESHLKNNYYYGGREWVYKNIKPRIVAEKYMTDESGDQLKDYKIFCFNGTPKLIQVDFGRFTANQKRNYYSPDWELQKSVGPEKNTDQPMEKPGRLDRLLEIAGILSAGLPHLRVDLYVIHDNIYFGEMTFYDGDGFDPYRPQWDKKLGDWIALPQEPLK
ncbi:MAG: hypothetical protein LBQ61_03330 [Spirochaetales bacterium]|jgi:hypothetical protein|nr:hypothetical protein [Spirochaetales bacterium]